MQAPPLRPPLPGPLAAARRRLILLASLGTPTPDSLEVRGFHVLLEPQQPDPRPRFGLSFVELLMEGLGARPGERVLDLRSGTGLPGLAAARAGAQVVVCEDDATVANAIRRGFLVAGLGAPPLWDDAALAACTEPFDLIAWLPPMLAGTATEDPRGARIVLADRTQVTNQLRVLRGLLARGGRLVFPFCDRDGTPWLQEALTDHGYRFALDRYVDAPVFGPTRLYKAWAAGVGSAGEVGAGKSLAGAGWVLRDR